jgi:hypothetical protein
MKEGRLRVDGGAVHFLACRGRGQSVGAGGASSAPGSGATRGACLGFLASLLPRTRLLIMTSRSVPTTRDGRRPSGHGGWRRGWRRCAGAHRPLAFSPGDSGKARTHAPGPARLAPQALAIPAMTWPADMACPNLPLPRRRRSAAEVCLTGPRPAAPVDGRPTVSAGQVAPVDRVVRAGDDEGAVRRSVLVGSCRRRSQPWSSCPWRRSWCAASLICCACGAGASAHAPRPEQSVAQDVVGAAGRPCSVQWEGRRSGSSRAYSLSTTA